MEEETKTVDAYILEFQIEIQDILENVKQVIIKAAPNAVEAIKYTVFQHLF